MNVQVQTLHPTAQPGSTVNRWKGFHRIAAIAAVLTLLTAVAEILITFLPGGYTTPSTVTEWFALLQANPFLGLRNLGLLNIVMTALGIPLMLALYAIHRKQRALPALAVILSFVGTAVFFATNRALPLLALSEQFAAAATTAESAALEAAGLAMLATGQSHTPGTFLAFFISEIAGILMAVVMLRERRFPQAAGIAGLVGYVFLLAHEIFASFVPSSHGAVLVIAMVGGLSNLAWYVLVAVRLFQPSYQKTETFA